MLLAPALHRMMARRALLAMVLLLAVPTIGRLAERGTSTQEALAAVCTVTGLKYVGLSQWVTDAAGMGSVTSPDPSMPHPDVPQHPGMDCDYCPLLATALVLAVLSVLLAWLYPQQSALQGLQRTHATVFLHPCGLGSRGPPTAL